MADSMNAATECLLDSSAWNARGFADGWQRLSATRDVTEPATGETLGTILFVDGYGASGNGTSVGGPTNADEYTRWRWTTIKGEAPQYPM